MEATPRPKFPDETWDGTTKATPDVSTRKTPDVLFGERYRAEIRSLEEVLLQYLDALDKLIAYGPGDSILGIKADGTELEYKVLIEGSGVVITHTPSGITISANTGGASFSGMAGEALSLGDVLYIGADGKAYKAQADADATSEAVGVSDRDAVLDDPILILPIGDVTNPGWSLTAGDLYYLSPTVAGGITSTPPSTTGQLIVPCGVATSTTSLAVDFRTRVKL